MATHETKPTFASPSQAMDMQRLAGKLFLKMPQSKANKYLNTAEGQKRFMKDMSELLKLPAVQNERALAAIPTLIAYYQKVFGIDISEIKDMEFPDSDQFPAYMPVASNLDEDQIMEAFKKYFKKDIYRYKSPAAKNINRDEEAKIQPRPSGLYIIAHTGQDEPDTKHRNKSYDDAVAEKMVFATAKEYLLMTGYHMFTKGYFMDKAGWTRTASLWSDGCLVFGYWFGDNSELWLSDGFRDNRNSDNGPREKFQANHPPLNYFWGGFCVTYFNHPVAMRDISTSSPCVWM